MHMIGIGIEGLLIDGSEGYSDSNSITAATQPAESSCVPLIVNDSINAVVLSIPTIDRFVPALIVCLTVPLVAVIDGSYNPFSIPTR